MAGSAPEAQPLPGFDAFVASKKKKKPLKVQLGSVSVPIYPIADKRWVIVWRAAKGGKRLRATRGTLAAAREKAENICLDIARRSPAPPTATRV